MYEQYRQFPVFLGDATLLRGCWSLPTMTSRDLLQRTNRSYGSKLHFLFPAARTKGFLHDDSRAPFVSLSISKLQGSVYASHVQGPQNHRKSAAVKEVLEALWGWVVELSEVYSRIGVSG
ncbi:hypothetical protein M413DRAFT_444259 [Hebeloma cylindrosporum]|uniref:Uncharacterized protein n=1 Tax=Hebeloma cylindrosporum TaxID=76867 RepID=A0A0C2XY16_HEBCY|nr:hypothetical protein M413DRAFT_444259 [Hebeloma cylindrosporum h7]